MKGLISSSEAVGWFEREGREWEVCATSEADYDEPRSELVVQLDCFARPADPRARETHVSVPWLPRPAEVREGVSHAEAPELAREIFRRWARQVRGSVHHNAKPSTPLHHDTEIHR